MTDGTNPVIERVAKALRIEGGMTRSENVDVYFRRLAQAALEAMPDVVGLREALTPSGDTKAAYHGEFRFDIMVRALDPDEDELVPMTVSVPWTTIKEIMAAIRDRAALAKVSGE